ncbi:MAG TPA: A/G-specific adenine glycosylase [Candidatus Limnocylindria bacterium]|nr:A/G-specific adenine glycosylase [Candidatus Limnocylindria bacterium]
MTLAEMQSAVIEWYGLNARDLAFRRTKDPWSVLLSEVIAQQTQARRAAEAWERLIAEFPTPASMAAASPASVIRAWRGLGYNRRALALHRAATAMVDRHGGRVPDALDDLLALPGIGPYTARAILSIAFDRPVAALDTNIRRVLSRAFLDVTPGPRALQEAADRLVPEGVAATWTHALMDIGAAFCRPRHPRCDVCPLRAHCRFVADGATVPPRTRPGMARRPTPRFESTSRWLRGRILDQLRDAPDGAAVAFDAGIGEHPVEAVHRALAEMARDGVIHLDPVRSDRACLPR